MFSSGDYYRRYSHFCTYTVGHPCNCSLAYSNHCNPDRYPACTRSNTHARSHSRAYS